ncbi:hypothetical protein V3C99_012995 [Haemonchus contortus]
MLGYTNDVIVSILVNGLFLISCIACITLFRRDSAKLRDLNHNLILMYQTIVVAVNVVIGSSLFTLTTTVLVNYSQWSPIAYVLTNTSFTTSFYLIALVYMVALDEVRIRFLLP